MKYIQKIISIFLIALIFSHVSLAHGLQWDITESEIELAEYNLLQIKNWDDYKKRIDALFEKHKDSQESIERLAEKLEKISNSGKDFSHNTKVLLNYIIQKNNFYILQNNSNHDFLVRSPIFLVQKAILEEVINEPQALSSTEKAMVEGEIISMQIGMYNDWINMMEEMFENISSISQYEQKWSMNIKTKINLGSEFNLDSEIALDDYQYSVSNFDSKFQWFIDTVFQWDIAGEEFSTEMEALIDFISKDGNLYLLIENLKSKGFETSYAYKNFQEVLEKIESQNKYVKFPDQQLQALYEILDNVQADKILGQWKSIFSESMLTAYAKNWEKFMLVPSKHACDSMKKMMNTFDPFHGDTCSSSQYKKLIKDMQADNMTIYMTMEEKSNTIGFSMWENAETLNLTIDFDENQLLWLNFTALENGKNLDDEHIFIDYKKASYLNISINLDDENLLYKMTSNLNSYNRFDTLDFKGYSKSFYSDSTYTLKLENKVFSGNIVSNMKSYDYDTGNYILSNKLEWTLNGTTQTNGKLQTLWIWLTGKDLLKQTQPMRFSFDYRNNKSQLDFSYENEWSSFMIDIDGTWDSDEKIFSSANLDIDYKAKEQVFSYETYQYSYSWAMQEVMNSRLEYNNSILTGQTSLSNAGNVFMTMEHRGTIEKKYYDIKNDFKIDKSIFGDAPYVNLSALGIEEDINGTIELFYDMRTDTETINYFFEVISGKNTLVELRIDANGTRTYKEIEIQVPSDVIDSEILFPTPRYYDEIEEEPLSDLYEISPDDEIWESLNEIEKEIIEQ